MQSKKGNQIELTSLLIFILRNFVLRRYSDLEVQIPDTFVSNVKKKLTTFLLFIFAPDLLHYSTWLTYVKRKKLLLF